MNRLTLAVAGGRKTQSIIDHCVAAEQGRRILVLTYTQNNQRELTSRLALHRPLAGKVEIQGWFSFLLGHWVRPYLPALFAGRRLGGLNFEGEPGRYVTGASRFLDSRDHAFKRHLAQLALEVADASDGSVLDRLSRLYDEIYIDEVQDLNGYDLEVLAVLMISPIELHMVGDVRQALLNTNVQDQKNKQYKGTNIKSWFDLQAGKGRLNIEHQSETWRCNQIIADFADGIFDQEWAFERTVSRNDIKTDHDGVFAVSTEHAAEYLAQYQPLCLRHSRSVMKDLALPFENIGVAKGRGADHVIIGPTRVVIDFIRVGRALESTAACSLYIAVTRARHSVAFVVNDPNTLSLPIWTPPG